MKNTSSSASNPGTLTSAPGAASSVPGAGTAHPAGHGGPQSPIAASLGIHFTFFIIYLAGISAFASFVNDMYLPSLPSMTNFFGAPASPLVGLGNILHSTAIVYLVHVALMIAAARLARKNAEDPTVGSRTK